MKLNAILSGMGYSSVAMPSSNIQPLQLLFRSKGDLHHQPDRIDQLLEEPSDFKLSPIQKDLPVPEISGTVGLTIDGSMGAKILPGLAQKLGLGASTTIQAGSNDSIVFAFEDPTKDEIGSIQELTRLLNTCRINPHGIKRELRKGKYFVITSVLKSARFAIGIVDKDTLSSTTAISVKKLLETDLTFSRESNQKRVAVYEGAEPVVFGIQAWQLDYKNPIFGKPYFRLVADSHRSTMKGSGEADEVADLFVSETPILFTEME